MSDLSGAFGLRSVTPPTVEVDFGAGPQTMIASMTVLNLINRVPTDGPVDFAALDAFPQARNILWSGADRGLAEALRTRPRIRFLEWRDPVGDIDLASTAVATLRLHGCGGLHGLRLPAMETLLLAGRSPALRVDLPDAGYDVSLRWFPDEPDEGLPGGLHRVRNAEPGVRLPGGLHRVRDLWLRVGAGVSASVLSGLTELAELRLDFDDPPGRLEDPHLLAACCRLRTISLSGAYALGPDDLPDLPELRRLELHGIRRGVARALRDHYRGSGVQVRVRGDVSDAWLARHLGNPFRDWVEDSEAAAEEAGSAYARALAAAEGITPSAPDLLLRAERALRRFVADFNGIDQRYGVIDTAEREQVWDAYRGLAARFHVPVDEEPSEWFDDGREF
ncbi:hypothetical protein FHR83_002999 [Actinoplanes campanulatus]|uniref:Uncharacterized protein n=1 Tax=Actinoplanes campanulatus TaxID=113559 RepID=A0A7W5FEE8_9ACTN|nr:hypothetical protein [Actinoplanes campanulatus]MBB3095336.1 hypothetical protein [Actinoplanes campanulatus]GGN41596.1 hypothetical protein GCM10010109_71820 [Actinoplanes campanulatus]GID34940.1 hypothetical protein Aca09nite_14460 [Actinoplanes campanulatus]